MALNRAPLGIVVNGAYMQVRDPNAADGAFMKEYRTVPGLGNFTLPAEAGSTNETALMDGVVGAAAFKGVGTITGAVGALGVHPTHLFLEEKSLDGTEFQMNIIRLAVNVQTINFPKAAFDLVDASTDKYVINIPAGQRDAVKSSVRMGTLVALADPAANPTEQTGNTVVDYAAAASSANDKLWQVVWAVEDDGSKVYVAPGFSSDKSTSTSNASILQIRNPGRSYQNILGTCSQWDAGDYQNGQNVAGNLTFQPSVQLARVAVEARTSLS